ncbi:fibronectin type III domain-containing protein [Dyadobacter frigoris]|uniref:T9SS type A sorting domain-containing protein n=1 Tax=Dyadobacter frigoris TaxID=2576211 RepID=A0A4U6D8L3_9BACT|nr:fibronectin type III domain-containing protein [Dyadobacter frigoris]TKT92597.1 T9SS type A sorting domain-containing protein [Dyadobacter frigoris]GLU51483.1 hypothetical protein Dfri01_09440 [Dyadobacter frigoris]
MKTYRKILTGLILMTLLFTGTKGFSQGSSPKLPRSLTVDSKSTTYIIITWIDSDLKTSVNFIIERSADGGNSFNAIGTLGSQPSQSNPQYTDPNLNPATQYCYRVKGKNTFGESAYSNIACGTTDAIPIPQGLNATATSPNSIQITWTRYGGKDSGETIIVERSTGSGGSFSQVGTSTADFTTFTDNGVSPSTQYCYRIKARTSGKDSGYSNVACATTQQTAPAAPSALIARSLDPTFQIQLNWIDGSNNETGFEIERSTDNVNFVKIATTAANISQYVNSGLAAETRYYYKVRAVNAVGSSGYTNVADAITNPDPPTVPVNLTATAASENQINLNWADNSNNETGFELERSQDGTNFSKIADAAANTTSYSSSGLSPNTQYWYRIRAKNNGGTSGYSNTANATTRDVAPAVPQNLSATPISNIRINLNWIDNSGNETGFEIERSADGNSFSKIADLGANVTSYENTGLSTLTKYWYRVRAKNTIGNSGYSNVAEATTLDIPPAAPSALTATTVSSSQIDLNWTDNSANESGFEIERSVDGSNFTKVGDTSANASTFQSTGLIPNTKYWFRVRSKNSQGGSPYTNVADATTKDVAPDAPQNLTATPASNTQINVSWTDISGTYGTETGYELEISSDGASFSKIADLGANVTNYQNTNLTTLTKYRYRLRAKNAIGYSPYSNIAETTTFDVPPIAPSSLTATMISSSQIDLGWKDNSANETTFEIERSTDGTTFDKAGEVGPNITAYQSTGLLPATRYWYRVRAKNSVNPSAYSDVANATTRDVLPNAPEALSATAISFQQIDLTWTDKSGNEAGFDIERSTDGTNFSKIAGVAANATAYQNTGLNQLTKYFFRIKALNAIGSSAYTNIVDATTPKAPIPDKPKNLTATPIDFDLVQLTWDPVSINATDVVIERSRKPDTDFVEIGTQTASITRFADREILEVQDYYYRIKAVNAAGGSTYSDLANVKGSSIITGTEPVQKSNLVYAYNKVLHIARIKPGRASVKIFNINGSKIKEFEISQISQTDLQQLTPGIYFVVLEEKNQVTKQKIAILSPQN